MKKYLILFLVTILTFSCNGQNRVELFNQYIKKFITCPPPITHETIDKYNLSADKPCNITKEEFNLFVKKDGDKFWKYKMYSKQSPNYYFNYVTGLKFDLEDNPNLIALIYYQIYLPDEFANIINEEILSIFNRQGELISSMPIEGSEADSLGFTSNILNFNKIEVAYTKYSEKSESKYTKIYCITKDGKIQLVKKKNPPAKRKM